MAQLYENKVKREIKVTVKNHRNWADTKRRGSGPENTTGLKGVLIILWNFFNIVSQETEKKIIPKQKNNQDVIRILISKKFCITT